VTDRGGPRPRSLPDEDWLARGRSRSEHAAEQDRAAGGSQRRAIRLKDGRVARGSVWFKRTDGFAYAYLRYTEGGRSRVRYIGPVTASNREEALREAWAEVHGRGLADFDRYDRAAT
jgi:DNA mismatch endonuclease (patch repair protein)